MILIGQDICEKLNVKEINKSEEDFIIYYIIFIIYYIYLKIIKIKKVFKYFCSLKLYIFFNYS